MTRQSFLTTHEVCIRKLVNRMTRDAPALAEDAFQGVCVELMRVDHDGHHSHTTFIYRRAMGVVADMKREHQPFHPSHHHRSQGAPFPGRVQLDTCEPASHDDGSLERHDDVHARVKTSLSRMTERDRKAVSMRYLDGMTCKQIGERMGVSKQSINQRIKRGLAMARGGS